MYRAAGGRPPWPLSGICNRRSQSTTLSDVVRRGKTPVLTEDQARGLLTGIAIVKTVRAP
jgi:hypothetical protein